MPGPKPNRLLADIHSLLILAVCLTRSQGGSLAPSLRPVQCREGGDQTAAFPDQCIEVAQLPGTGRIALSQRGFDRAHNESAAGGIVAELNISSHPQALSWEAASLSRIRSQLSSGRELRLQDMLFSL